MTGNEGRGAVSAAVLCVEAQDLVDAYRCHHRGRLREPATLLALAAALGLGAVFLAFALTLPRDLGWFVGIMLAALLGGLLAPRAMIRWVVPIAGRRVYRQQRDLHEPIEMRWDHEAVRTKTTLAVAALPWSHVMRWREDARALLLYRSEALFQFAPKRSLSEEQLASLRACAAAAGVKGAQRPEAGAA